MNDRSEILFIQEGSQLLPDHQATELGSKSKNAQAANDFLEQPVEPTSSYTQSYTESN